MTNLDFINFAIDNPYFLRIGDDYFRFKIGRVYGPHKYRFGLYAGQIVNSDDRSIFNFTLTFGKRNISFGTFNYSDVTHQMKFKPDELIEWSPAILLSCTNYRVLLRYLTTSLHIFFDENPKCRLILPF